jgi:hypothetical protein
MKGRNSSRRCRRSRENRTRDYHWTSRNRHRWGCKNGNWDHQQWDGTWSLSQWNLSRDGHGDIRVQRDSSIHMHQRMHQYAGTTKIQGHGCRCTGIDSMSLWSGRRLLKDHWGDQGRWSLTKMPPIPLDQRDMPPILSDQGDMRICPIPQSG